MDFSKPFQVVRHIWWEDPFYTEGPVMDSNGNGYFTTLSGGEIKRSESAGEAAHWASSTCPNGQAVLPGSDIVICDSKEAALKRFDAAGNFLRYEVRGYCAGEQVMTPNDVVADEAGGLYFTDSIRHQGKVFYKAANGVERLLTSGLDYPNGLALSSQAGRLFVAESYRNRVLELNLEANDTDAYRVFATLPQHGSGRAEANLPDGMAVDAWGNLWVAHYGMGALQVLDQGGNLVATIPTGLPLTSNLCFLCFDPLIAMVTGGLGEPGPGRVVRVTIEQSV